MQATMAIVCGWCDKDMGTKPGACTLGNVTHTICTDCRADMMMDAKPPPAVDEELVRYIGTYIAGRDSAHHLNQYLTGYMVSVDCYHRVESLAERIHQRNTFAECETILKAARKADKDRRGRLAMKGSTR